MCRCSISPFRMTCMFAKPVLSSSTHNSPFHIRLPMIGLLQVRHIQNVSHSVFNIQWPQPWVEAARTSQRCV